MTASREVQDRTSAEDVPAGAQWVHSAVAALVVGLVVLGSLVLTDDAWPFSPFRMFSAASKVNGAVTKPELVGLTATGRELTIDSLEFGLRRAEIEGNMVHGHLTSAQLGDLARVWNERHPRQRLVRLEQRQIGQDLEEGRPVGRIDRRVSLWEAR